MLKYEFKGDAPCADCGREFNPVWWTDNVFWNDVMGDNVVGNERMKIICPLCFMARAEQKYNCAWRILPDWKWNKK